MTDIENRVHNRIHDSAPQNPAQPAPGRKNSLVPSATGIRRAAMDRLARREYARCELEEKLRRRFPDATAAIGPVLDQLEHEGLLSTSRFIESFNRSRVQRGQGPRRILADLRARGLKDVPAPANVDWLAQAREVRRRRFGDALPMGQVERNRQMAFLQRRGFTVDICRQSCLPPRDND